MNKIVWLKMKLDNCLISVEILLTYGWIDKPKQGTTKRRPNQPPGNNPKILDWEKFRDFVKSHADKKPVEIAELWHEEISDRTISRALKKLALREKKDLWLS